MHVKICMIPDPILNTCQFQTNAREAAELEEERIKERSLELKRLRQDQLERARLRHNVALEKELLKYVSMVAQMDHGIGSNFKIHNQCFA